MVLKMKKKFKDLTNKEIDAICFKMIECSDNCPLYRVEKGRLRLCIAIEKENYKYTSTELEKLEEEIEVENE